MRRQDQRRDGTGVAHGAIADLDGIDNARLDHIDGRARARVEAMAIAGFGDLGDRGRAVATAIGDDAGKRLTQRPLHQLGALLGAALQFFDQRVQRRSDAQQRNAAARDNALFDSGAGRIDRIFDQLGATLLFDRRRPARQDHRRAAR